MLDYTQFSNHEMILEEVKKGEKRFRKAAEEAELEHHLSNNHPYEDVEAQAFMAAITSSTVIAGAGK